MKRLPRPTYSKPEGAWRYPVPGGRDLLVWPRRRGEWFAVGSTGGPEDRVWVIAATRTQAARALYALLGVS